MQRMVLRSLVVVVALSACSSKKEEGAGTSAAKQPEGVSNEERDFIVQSGKRELERLQKGLAEGNADKYACAAAMANVDKVEPYDKDTATKIRTLCNHDIPVAILTKGVPVAEEARKNAPDKITLSECTIDVDMAIEELDTANAHDDASRALVARYDKACPINAQARADRAKRNAAKPAK
jgi:hypothetical protein